MKLFYLLELRYKELVKLPYLRGSLVWLNVVVFATLP